jgi:hypothetical protein
MIIDALSNPFPEPTMSNESNQGAGREVVAHLV